MNVAAAVSNAGGISVLGGVRQSPKPLQSSIDELYLKDRNGPFDVDLPLPQVGGSARKQVYPVLVPLIMVRQQKDYIAGQLPELRTVINKSKASLFVCAVGVPPKWVFDKIHNAGIALMKGRLEERSEFRITSQPYHFQHVLKALAQGETHFRVKAEREEVTPATLLHSCS